jgi:hypothetical protein
MRLFAFSLLGMLTCGSAAIACPDPTLSQGATAYAMDQLAVPQGVALIAGGEHQLDQCGLGLLGFGQFRSAPDHSLVVTGDTGRDVVLAVTSDCDAAMLVHAADGAWHFNDDANGNLDPRLVLPAGAALDGQVDIWVGTFDGGECAATLNVAQAGAVLPVAPPMSTADPVGGRALAPVDIPPAPMPVPTQAPQPAPVPAPVPVPAPMPAPMPAPVPAAICPNPDIVGPSLTLVGAQLLQPQAYVAQVGGQHEVAGCPGIDGWGYANEAPGFTLFLSQMDGFTFTAETTSDCDPTMIIRDALGQWHFNDDGPNGVQPQVQLNGASLNGRVDIWVGSFGGDSCEGTIVFRTSSGALPMPQPGVQVGGCPDPGLQGVPVTITGEALYSPTDFVTTAAGSQSVGDCGLPVMGGGYFDAQPNFSFFLSGMQDYGRLEIEGEAACDTVMLVRTPDGQWHYDDDSNGNLNPRLNLTNTVALNGRVDVWVGTYGGTSCPATIEMETWRD